jgi:hypothetical protein
MEWPPEDVLLGLSTGPRKRAVPGRGRQSPILLSAVMLLLVPLRHDAVADRQAGPGALAGRSSLS